MRADLSVHSVRAMMLLLIGCAVSGCSSSNIYADYDHDADFGAYATYDFIEGAGNDYEGYESAFTRHMIAAITVEMEKRGYVKEDSPDLFVNFKRITKEKTQVTQTQTAPPGYYGYRRGYYGSWGSYGYGTETHVSEYTEGTYNIDIIDAREKKLIWEAVGIGRISEKKLANLERTVNEGVPKFFALYPFVAGNPVPVQTK